MKPYFQKDDVTIYHGDAREILPQLNLAADCCIVDPVWPNSIACLSGSDRPAELFAEVCPAIAASVKILAVHLGVDSDPRFLMGVPASMPFIRSCALEYALARPKGQILYTGDTAYIFGRPPKAKPGRQIIPGKMVSSQYDFTRPRTQHSNAKAFEGQWTVHPCPRRLEHVRWLVKWLADGLVLDPFCGSGTTLLAAKEGGYAAVGIEINEAFCEVAANRMEQGVLFGDCAGVA